MTPPGKPRRLSRKPWPLLLVVALLFSPGEGADPAELSLAARWLQAYLRIETVNPPGHEERAAELLARLLAERGIPSRRLVSPSGRVNLYARRRAQPGVDGPALLLLHHMDVVAPGSGWTRPPFAGEVADGRLWGRGALDCKSLGIAHLAAFLALPDDALQRDLVFLAVADEERGGIEGTAWLLAEHPELFTNVAAVLNEGAANRQVNGRLLWWGVEVAQKRPLWLKVTARGRGGHGAGFSPSSAPHDLVRALARLVDRPPRWRVTPAVRNYLQALSPLHNRRWQEIFDDIDRKITPTGPAPGVGLMPGMANLFIETIQVNVLQAAPQINVIPPEASARIDVRLLPDTDGEALLAELRELLGEEVEVEVLLTAPPSAPSPHDGKLFRLLERTLGPEAPVVPFFSPGFTDSRFFRQRGVPAYGFSPFTLEPQDQLGIHGANERIPLDELDRGVERMRRVVETWARGPS